MIKLLDTRSAWGREENYVGKKLRRMVNDFESLQIKIIFIFYQEEDECFTSGLQWITASLEFDMMDLIDS